MPKTISVDELAQRLQSVRGARAITITASTIPEMRKKNNPHFGRVKKVQRLNGMINWQYEAAVNNQRLREGAEPDFDSAPRQWGQRILGTPFVEHKGKRYLEMKCQRSVEVIYLEDDKPVDKAALEEFLVAPSSNKRQDLEKEVILRDFLLDNILQVDGLGEYLVVHHEPMAPVVPLSGGPRVIQSTNAGAKLKK